MVVQWSPDNRQKATRIKPYDKGGSGTASFSIFGRMVFVKAVSVQYHLFQMLFPKTRTRLRTRKKKKKVIGKENRILPLKSGIFVQVLWGEVSG